MARDQSSSVTPAALSAPAASLLGQIDEQLAESFIARLKELDDDVDIAIELTTLGGDEEMARRIVLEIETARTRRRGRVLLLGKTAVYSAGMTIMSAFPRADRYLTADTMLMVHCRQLDRTIEVDGPMRASLPKVEALCRQIETGIALEEENFRRLIQGSDVGLEELNERALYNWYLPAAEALRRNLVAGVIGIAELAGTTN